ncbi:hypothetical protein WJX72_009684 [[Myrmecia] bisecta]|uniref:Uncharacterized protein n=1 Tax=[Myrmecia] bisecta TaxID=41462 RepID=A0AAW1Q1S4_9CHLO
MPSATAAAASTTGNKFSAARSHELNDAYMDEFEEAYAQLSEMQLQQADPTAKQRPKLLRSTSRGGRQPERIGAFPAATPQAAAVAEAADAFSAASSLYPCTIAAGWREGPLDPAGVCCSLSDQPLLCGSVDWAAGEVAVGSSDHAIYTVELTTGKRRRTLYNKNFGHSEAAIPPCWPDTEHGTSKKASFLPGDHTEQLLAGHPFAAGPA